jgi:hypothetical protein
VLIDCGNLLATPRVERVIDHQPVTQHLVVIGKIRRQSERYRIKPIALRSEVAPRCISTAHDRSQTVEGRVLDFEDADNGVEGTVVADMPELGPFNVRMDLRLFFQLRKRPDPPVRR